MRVIDRLLKYLSIKGITAYSFEKTCQVANGYLKKQVKGKGTIGSDIVERIHRNYADLNILWLITGQEKMLLQGSEEDAARNLVQEEKAPYSNVEMIHQWKERIRLLERLLADKEKIISLLEAKRENLKKPKK